MTEIFDFLKLLTSKGYKYPRVVFFSDESGSIVYELYSDLLEEYALFNFKDIDDCISKIPQYINSTPERWKSLRNLPQWWLFQLLNSISFNYSMRNKEDVITDVQNLVWNFKKTGNGNINKKELILLEMY